MAGNNYTTLPRKQGSVVVCKSQYEPPLMQLWDGFNPLGSKDGTFVVFRGYIDESYRDEKIHPHNVFTLACLVGIGSEWKWVAYDWKRCIQKWNKYLKKQNRKPLARYHASDCSNCLGDFENWSIEEQKTLTSDLVQVISKYKLESIAFSVAFKDLEEVFSGPDASLLKPDMYGFLYGALLRLIMFELDYRYCRHNPSLRITLFHDRCEYDAEILRVFNRFIKHETLEHKECFSTIAPLSWEDCVPLQPADMLAYENFKDLEGKLAGRKRRISLELLLDLDSFGGRARVLDRPSLLKIRDGLRKISQQTEETTKLR